MLELIGHEAFEGGGLNKAFDIALGKLSWNRFAAVEIWVFTCFLIFVTARELNRVAGPGVISRLLFKVKSSEWQVTRHQDMRSLLEIIRLVRAAPDFTLLSPAGVEGQRMLQLFNAIRRQGGRGDSR